MKVLTEYTWNHLKKNRKNTISILIAITIGTILLNTIVLATYMNWNHDINKSILRKGNYHGTFNSYIRKSQISYLKENQRVDKVYLGTEFYIGKIDLKKKYINISARNKDYWENMSEKNSIIEGRIPEEHDEIVVMANFIKENPQFKIGDKLDIGLGYRQKDGKKIDIFDFIHSDEIFIEEKGKEYTIVGTISGKSLSYEPYYGGLGFLDEELIDEDIKMTPFLRMKNPRNIYKDLPEIGKILGFDQGEEIDREYLYGAGYNSYYLRLQGIFPPSIKFWERFPPSIFLFFIFILLSVFLFAVIIYNVFAVWSNNRLRQLGILKSIGATPKQIKRTVKLEAVLLSIIPIILGVILGHLFCYILIDRINSIVNNFQLEMDGSIFNLQFKTSPIMVGITIIISFLTVLLSISKSAKRLSRILPIEAIKNSGLNYEYLKKKRKKGNNYSPSNIIPSLSKDSLNGNKKGFKTTIISITISFVILFVFLLAMGAVKINSLLNTIEPYHPLQLRVFSSEIIDENLYNEVRRIPEIKESILYKRVNVYYKVKPDYASEDFKRVGGFEGIDKIYDIKKTGEDYEVEGEIIGLDSNSFDEYVKAQGENPEEYYDKENPKAILLNLVKEDMNQPLVRANFISYLNEKINNLSFNELQGRKGDKFNLEIGLKTLEDPIKGSYLSGYNICLFLPKEVLNSLMEKFELPGDYSHSEYMRFLVDDKDIDKVKEEIRDITEYYLPGDYYIFSILDDENEKEMTNKILYLITFSIVSFIGVIGVSNAYSSINNNLRNRRREFAMLKSMGITKKDLRRMLSMEGIYYGVYPFIFAIPISLFILAFAVKINKVFTAKDFLMFIDYKVIVGYFIIIFASIYLAYYFGIRKVEKDDIVNVLKDESI